MAKFTNLSQNFTMIPNWLINNKDISLSAKGLFIYLASKPNDFDFSAERIASKMKEGLSAVKSYLRELETYGYLTRKKLKQDGKFIGIEYYLTDKPTENIPVGYISTDGKSDGAIPTDINKKDYNKKEDIYIPQAENSEIESNAVKHLKKENATDITAAEFLERWKAARLHYDKKPTHISKLYFNEAQNFKTLVKEGYTLKDFDQAIAGLFFQNTLPNVRLRPDHLLQPERFEFYLDCYRNNIKPFNKGYKKTNDKTGML